MRNKAIDIAKGICIMLMILGHCSGMPSIICAGINSFHMPFFFMASGFFFYEKEISMVIKSGFYRLIMPMLIVTFICVIINLIMGNESGAFSFLKAILYPGGTRGKDVLFPNWPNLGVLWFLAALFWCKILYTIIYTYIGKYIIPICAALSWLIIILSRRLMFPFGISEALSGLVFYAVGHWGSLHDVTKKSLPWYVYVIFLILWILEINFVTFGMFQCSYTWYLFPIGTLFACGMSFVVYKLAVSISTCKTGDILSYAGLFCLEIMCCHQIVRVLIDNLAKEYELSSHHLLLSIALILGSLALSIIYITNKKQFKRFVKCKNS